MFKSFTNSLPNLVKSVKLSNLSRNFFTVIKQYERGVKLSFGKFSGELEPGLRLSIPFYHKIHKVYLPSRILTIPVQSLISKDGVTFQIHSSVQYKVTNPTKTVLDVDDINIMLPERCQMSLRQILSSLDISGILHGLKDISLSVKNSLESIEKDWGIEIGNVQIVNIEFDESVKRAMSVKAEAERMAEAKVINAESDVLSAQILLKAAKVYEENPITLRLREFQLWTTVSQNPSSSIYVIPSNLLDFMNPKEVKEVKEVKYNRSTYDEPPCGYNDNLRQK
jgi:hypothetical protein